MASVIIDSNSPRINEKFIFSSKIFDFFLSLGALYGNVCHRMSFVSVVDSDVYRK